MDRKWNIGRDRLYRRGSCGYVRYNWVESAMLVKLGKAASCRPMPGINAVYADSTLESIQNVAVQEGRQ